jgi:hypothetical protein
MLLFETLFQKLGSNKRYSKAAEESKKDAGEGGAT